jgi:hypothetical protein
MLSKPFLAKIREISIYTATVQLMQFIPSAQRELVYIKFCKYQLAYLKTL